MSRRRFGALAGLGLLTACSPDSGPRPARDVAPAALTPLPPYALQDSLGVNVHVTYNDTAYGDVGAMQAALTQLGVRHVRDGLVLGRPDEYDLLRRFAGLGIKTTLIVGSPTDSDPSVATRLAVIRAELRDAVEALEGPNELDVARPDDFAPALRDYQRELFTLAHADPELGRLPVIAPSLGRPTSRPDLGLLTDVADFGNIHPYSGGRLPEPTLSRELTAQRLVTGDRPVVATEAGYHTGENRPGQQPGVDPAVEASYLPRLLLEALRLGIRRTFLYELADQRDNPDPESSFGLLRHDWTPKPAYDALGVLLDLTGRRPGSGEPGPMPRVLPPVRLMVQSAQQVHQLLLSTADGGYALALWRPVSDYDEQARQPTPVDPVDVRVQFPASVRGLTAQSPVGPASSPTTSDALTLAVSADAALVRWRP